MLGAHKEVMVVMYGDQEIQISSKGILYDINSTVYVKYDGNKFTLSTKEAFGKAEKKSFSKKESKDTEDVAVDDVEK